MAKVITVTNQKGGVGKTTTSINLAFYLAKKNRTVLLIDFDPQGNATSGLGIDKRNLKETMCDVMLGETEFKNVICQANQKIKKLFVAPTMPELANVEVQMADMEDKFRILKKAIDSVKDDYDYIIIDSPPSLSLLTVNGMIAADYLLLPVQTEFYALEGVAQLLESMNLVKKAMNPKLKLLGVLATMYDRRTVLSSQTLAELKRYFKDKVFETTIPTESIDSTFDPTADEDAKDSKLREIKVSDIEPDPDQPRRDFKPEQLQALANSIKEHGVLQPIVVTKDDNKYKIVAGERRWRASKIAEIEKIPAIVRSLDAQNRLELSLIENVQREDLNAIETATAYAKLKNQFNMSSEEVAKRVGKSESAVINTMRLLSLPEEAKHAMVEYKLSEGQMRPLITATPEQIKAVLPKIINESWSARKVEQYMVEVKARAKAAQKAEERPVSAESESRAAALSKKLGVGVKVRTNARGSGDIVLKFKDEKEFEKLCSILTA